MSHHILHVRRGLACLAVVLLAGCSTTASVVSDGGDSNLMLRGHDAVAYFTTGKALDGHSDIKAEHRGLNYRFVSEENRRQFITAPERYAPQFGGYCTQAMVHAVPAAADGENFKIIDGRLYLFSSPRARLYFEMDQERNLNLARHYWDAEVKDSNSYYQAGKRLFFKVPHYKSDEQLAEEYERRFSNKPAR